VKAFKPNLLGSLIVSSMLLFNSGTAKADTLVDFTITGGGLTETFTVPQSPTPSAFNSGEFELANVPVLVNNVSATDNINFLGTSLGGGLNDFFFQIFDTSQFFNGTTAAPSFAPGTFDVTATGTFADFPATVTIADVATTPLPAALPLFAAGLGAMGFAGWRRKRNAPAA
jgi:hypothetical protein